MKAELLVLRHGESVWAAGVDDIDRSLEERGKRCVQRVGVWLSRQGVIPDYVVSSPARRAVATAEETCKAVGLRADVIQTDRRIYSANVDSLLAVLRECPDQSKRVLIVGHNPGLTELLHYLADSRVTASPDGALLQTAALARLSTSNCWIDLCRGCAQLDSVTHPSSLPEKYPFPQLHSVEWRERPAYYYTQSSVIPYRWRGGEVEILVITSKKRKHWLVPKGVKDPGFSPQESAAKEAREEAGVEGTVMDSTIGNYTYVKWGAICTVDVYPMEVSRILSESQWEERYRRREWVTPETAAARLRQEALKPIVMDLAAKLKAG